MSSLPARTSLRGWLHARLPLTDNLLLTQRNVYVLPSRAGWLLLATLAVLLLASINYQLSLGYLFTFLLAGCAVVGMHLGHATLRGMRLGLETPAPQFAGASAVLGVVLTNEGRRMRHAIGLALLDAPTADRWSWTDVAPQASATVRVSFQPTRRGLHRVPPLVAETRFPMGAFRIWTVWKPAAQVLVWPAPEAHPPPLPQPPPGASGAPAPHRARQVGEFEGVRSYRRGDSLGQVVWKKAARTGELVSRDSQPARRGELWLDIASAGDGDIEQRLARLTAWVLQAERLGLRYGLRVPGRQIAPDAGEAHKRHCLEALALC
ncbi:DUF58 domain-containing protein [Ramlibacter sp. AN1015]|uniref:DUF58 domain-containing protein n=1 Tax=Ramlibacter sp. AN1015 TaxID=3133428 RepID=UPI0030BD24F2